MSVETALIFSVNGKNIILEKASHYLPKALSEGRQLIQAELKASIDLFVCPILYP